MARRMFTPEIVESDSFYDLSPSSQALYLHLCMNADDDGFVNTARRIVRLMGVTEGEIEELVNARFLIEFDDFVYCIKHWLMHNKIRSDRKKMTTYQDELNLLDVKENGAYSQKIYNVRTNRGQIADKSRTNRGQIADKSRTNRGQLPDNSPHRLGKDRLGKDRLGKDRLGKDRLGKEECAHAREGATPTAYGIYKNVLLTKEQIEDLRKRYPDHWENRIDKFSTYLHQSNKNYNDHYGKIIQFAVNDNVPTESSKADRSYDLDDFFQAAVSKGGER